MGKPGAFLEYGRKEHGMRPIEIRMHDFDELYVPLTLDETRVQASRCMACGVPFCQVGESFGKARPSGCPLHNLIPEWNDLVYRGLMKEAAERLALTSPMPEFTSRVCPALCEAACNLGRDEEAETIHDNERAISDWQWENGGPRHFEAPRADAPRVAVVGSGPSGLVAAWELARRGCRVVVFERRDRAGGLLMYGIPNMKLDKSVVTRRTDLMAELGIEFRLGVDVCENTTAAEIVSTFDAVVVAAGATAARGVAAQGFEAGIEAGGVVYAVDYLTESTRSVLEGRKPQITAAGKDVIIIGGGDTGTDCMGTAVRQGARTVRQLEYGPCAPEVRAATNQWPEWPFEKKTDYGQQEAIALQGEDLREWQADTKEILFDSNGAVRGIRVESLDWSEGRPHTLEGSSHELDAQLVLIACGFTGPDVRVMDAFGVKMPEAGRPLPVMEKTGGHKAVRVNDVSTREGVAQAAVYVAGDARNGSTLVVNAMADALACAAEVCTALL